MKAVLIIIIWLNTGAVTSEVKEVDDCPDRNVIFSKYEKLKTAGALLDWAALCTRVTYNPIKKPKTRV